MSLFRSTGERRQPPGNGVGGGQAPGGRRGAERRIFARAFAEFVQRQHIARASDAHRHPGRPGERRSVGGRRQVSPTLTNLEYRLLLLLYGRLGKICTKYEVVEAVWGEEYIDEVDDARIEKLISRLRQKHRAGRCQPSLPDHRPRPGIQAGAGLVPGRRPCCQTSRPLARHAASAAAHLLWPLMAFEWHVMRLMACSSITSSQITSTNITGGITHGIAFREGPDSDLRQPALDGRPGAQVRTRSR